MKTKVILIMLMPLLIIGEMAFSQAKLTARSSSVIVSGSSTMHDWSMKATKVSVNGDFTIVDGSLKKINSATVKIEAKSLKSHQDSDLMDERTYKTINAEKFPLITFEYLNTVSTNVTGNSGTIKVNGNLTIAGVTKPTDLILSVTTLANGDLQIKGTEKILLTSHKIKPPSFMAGAIKVADQISIAFDVILKK
ncbi:YceI family protein [Lacihabitans sp. LS3-19]|uniref:YceI family protein n=1 Tax=Lacihabitans sp. LS3-19 TaxID=2487335 RepID=UPI0020CCB2C4|nr:YceI family protein [Lacihabitans sp. LS3-19]MCP9766933.1 YceI family protein [Lacihabitans sp. LS3-19]